MDLAQFVNHVKLNAFDDAYIDEGEEKEIMKTAVQGGVSVDQAQSWLKQACANFDIIREADLKQLLAIVLERFHANEGKIDLDKYRDAIAIAMK